MNFNKTLDKLRLVAISLNEKEDLENWKKLNKAISELEEIQKATVREIKRLEKYVLEYKDDL